MAGTVLEEGDLRRKRQKLSTTITNEANNITTSKDSSAMDLSQPAEADVGRNFREEQVGILQYVNTTNPGFNGILKKRYTDFLVNEIMEDGTVVHLTDTSMPKPQSQPEARSQAVVTASSEQLPDANVSAEKVQLDAEIAVAESDVKAKKIPVAIQDTEMVDASDVKVEQNGNAAEETKTGEDHVKISVGKEDAQDGKIEANGSNDVSEEHVQKSDESVIEKSPVSDDDQQLLKDYFGAEVRDSILALYQKVLQRPDGKAASYGVVISEPINDRQLRTKIHQNIRRIFNSKFETTSDADGTMKVSVAGKLQRAGRQENSWNNNSNRGQTKGKIGWNELGGEHLHFSLLKENKDTMEVISFMAISIRMQSKSFAFAGTKDRRGVTVQRISLFRGDAKKLLGLNKDLRGSKIGGLKYEKHGLNLGDLRGNEFVITLRDCHFAGEESLDESARLSIATKVVGDAVKNMSEHGFLNYYGLQRFGSFSTGTDKVGRFILKGDFRGAVQAILTFNPELLDVDAEKDNSRFSRDDISRAISINLFESKGNNEAAIRRMPRKFSAEAAMLRWLKGNRQNDYIGALLSISRGLRLMYVHAYQSLVWNRAASERWARFGDKVVEGDLVLVDAKDAKNGNSNGRVEADEVDESGEVIIKPASDDVAVSLEDQFQRARHLSKEEASSGDYSIFDIVLPTPGYDVEYPKNEIGEFYKEFMASEEGGGLDPMDMRRSQKDFSLSGSYRKLIAVAEDVSFQVKMYSEEDEQLVETDLDRFYKGKTRPHPHQRFPQQPRFTQQERTPHQPQFSRQQELPQQQQQLPPSNPWANFKGLAASDKVLAEAARARNAAVALEERPKVEENFIETSATTGERTGHHETTITEIKAPAVEKAQASISEPTTLSAPEDIPLPVTPQPESKLDASILKRSADQMYDSEMSGVDQVEKKDADDEKSKIAEIPAEESTVAGDGMTVDEAPIEKKVAVVVTFKLGSSQYATMALRELMKSGGVQEYKTVFAGR